MDDVWKCTKSKFNSESSALEFVKEIKNKSDRDKVPIRAYKCKYCSSWHITSQLDNKILLQEKIKKEHDRLLRNELPQEKINRLFKENISLQSTILELNKKIYLLTNENIYLKNKSIGDKEKKETKK